ncbi:TolC family protein [Acinetobacter chinensis]|jgi:adhesin transport system outer membrane protein|uniref:TolC family protein n=1 Tax=Acinetobacter chinensis TaxID=2004650 RepID=UPI002934DE9A|nr:TolC family protein [Acinetobacter chinensis]WOE40417.1 TolC family protein [Acinetobacter chinensis]
MQKKYQIRELRFSVTKGIQCLICIVPLQMLHAETTKGIVDSIKTGASQLLAPKPVKNVNQANIQKLSNFQVDTSRVDDLPVLTGNFPVLDQNSRTVNVQRAPQLSFNESILRALQRSPDVTRSLSTLAAQGANIDVAKAGYYPQISGGVSTADLTRGERGRQLFNITATQMVYDFGKIRSAVDVQEAKLASEQALVLVSLDDVALQTASAIVNTERYKKITQIAQQQIEGISRIAEIANLRAKAGISTQADPVQAQSNLEAAQSNLIVQQNLLNQYKQKLKTLLGYDVSNVGWNIPDRIVQQSALYQDPEFNRIPKMIAAQASVEVAKFQKKQVKLSSYPTLNLKGSLSQAVNGVNPNNNEDDGFYSSIMLEASSSFYQGGAVSSQTRAASYAEEAAKAQVSSVYLEVQDEVRLLREEIENKQRQMSVLVARKQTAIRTKELYQEQYKLGTRSAVDLLTAEQTIHSSASEIENARYDMYAAIIKYIAVTGRSRDVYDLNNISIQGFEIQP